MTHLSANIGSAVIWKESVISFFLPLLKFKEMLAKDNTFREMIVKFEKCAF